MLATAGQAYYSRRATRAALEHRPTPPEARLGLAFFGAIIVPISLFLFAFTAPYPHVHWIAPCIAEFGFALGTMLIFTGFIPLLIDCYLATAASALSSGMFSRAVVASAFPLFSVQMYHKLGIVGATCLLAGLSCLLAPIPWLFVRWGDTMRERSRHAVVQ